MNNTYSGKKINIGQTIFFIKEIKDNIGSFWSVKRGVLVEILGGYWYKTKNGYTVNEEDVYLTYSQARKKADKYNA